MSTFDFLPILNDCCGANLKVGVIIVCLLTWIFVASVNYPVPSKCIVDKFYYPLRYLTRIKIATSSALALATFLLFIGVYVDWPLSCAIYCVVAFIYFLFDITTTIMLVISGFVQGVVCGEWNLVILVLNCLFPLILLYFIIIVNSYEDEMWLQTSGEYYYSPRRI